MKGLRNKNHFNIFRVKLGWWMMRMLFDLIIMTELLIGGKKTGPPLEELSQVVYLQGQAF